MTNSFTADGSVENKSCEAPRATAAVEPDLRASNVTSAGGASGRFQYIDGLRGVAAGAVMLYHFTGHRIFEGADGQNTLGSLRALCQYGNLGVPIFFVISGFVIAHSVGHSKVGPRYLANFAVRRSIRLDPPYWIAIAAAVAGGLLSRSLVGEQGTPVPTLGCIAAHVAYIYPVLGYQPIESVFWTLVHEVQFYILYVVLLGVVQRLSGVDRPSPWLLLLFFCVSAILSATGWYHVTGLCLDTWYMFVLGVMSYWWFSGDVSFWQIAAVAACIAGMLAIDPKLYKCAALATMGSVWAAIYFGTLASWLGFAAIQYLGTISYSLYLFHGIVGWRVLSVGERLTGTSFLWSLVWLAGAIGASIAASHLMRQWVEIPSIRLGKCLKPRTSNGLSVAS